MVQIKTALNYIRQLAGQTMVYGFGIIVPRLLNFLLLTPFYTRIFDKAEYGIITELYAYVVFLMVFLTYGMETAYFRFSDSENKNKNIYKSALGALFTTSLLFIFLASVFSDSIATLIDYPDHPEYIIYIALIVAIDSFTTIPFARLRLENKPIKYSLIRICEILINITGNWFFLYYSPRHPDNNLVSLIYNPEIGVGYVLITNLISNIFKIFALSKEILFPGGKFDFAMLRRMLVYSLPLLIAGLAGTVNEALDRVLIKYLIPAQNNPMEQLGIYGANFKMAVLMTLFIQMFRYAAEPFFFSKKDEKNAGHIYATVMKYFVFSGMVIFLFVMFFMDIFKYFIGKQFWEGLEIVPIVLLANLLMGIFYNLSIWYKLTNKTIYGAYLVIAGGLVTILVNWLFIPQYGYYASAWGHLISYSIMVILSYVYGQKFYNIPYDLKRILLYVLIAFSFYLFSSGLDLKSVHMKYLLNTLLIITYAGIFYVLERRFSGGKIKKIIE